ncbi:MAG: HNH endonuclease, partial [Myxococcales bacterium]|nr:HNH endonuclease [Myxococcales bacterium]
PAALRREVYERDGGRCTYVSGDGRRCSETGGLEFDHLDGFARVGEHRAGRIALKCRAHNQHAADALYGRAFMDDKRHRIRPGADNSASGTANSPRQLDTNQVRLL